MATENTESRQPMSNGTRLLIGCGGMLFLLVISMCIGAFGVYRWGSGKVNEFAQPFEDRGYKRITAQVHQVFGDVDQPTVYTVQVLQIMGDINTDIAVMTQVMEIKATINGDIDFYGQVLHVAPGGVVNGNIRSTGAQAIIIDGKVTGKITGSYQQLKNNSVQPAPVEAEMDSEAETDDASEDPLTPEAIEQPASAPPTS